MPIIKCGSHFLNTDHLIKLTKQEDTIAVVTTGTCGYFYLANEDAAPLLSWLEMESGKAERSTARYHSDRAAELKAREEL